MTRADYRHALKGRKCYVGMDLSSTKDLTALVAVFPDGDGGFDVLSQFFVPGANIRLRSQQDRAPYDQFVRNGFMVATEGDWVNFEAVRQTLKDWAAEFQIREIAYDPWNAIDLVTRLKDQDGFVMVPMRQGFASLSAPSKAFEKAILSKALRHDGHPVLRWCVSNVSVDTDPAGNIKPSKTASTEKIDGVVALVMAIARMDVNNSSKEPAFQMMVMGGR